MRGRSYVGGKGAGPVLATGMPFSVTASLSKPINMLPWARGKITDRHHELLGKELDGTVFVFPACIGSTYTGMMLMELLRAGHGPAAIVVGQVDSLLVSGVVLAKVWFGKGIPVVEYDTGDLMTKVKTGDWVEVDGDTGSISVRLDDHRTMSAL